MRDAQPSNVGLADIDAETWGMWIEAIGLPALVVAIERRMSARLRTRCTAEDVLQEALLLVWRDRQRLEWRGLRAFRALVLRAAIHRIHDLADGHAAERRGGAGGEAREADLPGGATLSGTCLELPVAIATTTPSRIARGREQARVLNDAIEALPEELGEVVRLRILEERSTRETADELGIGESAVKHRLRKGFALFSERLGGAGPAA